MEYVKIKSIVNVADSVADEDSLIIQQGSVSKQVARATFLEPYRKSADEDILLAEIGNRLTALERRPDWRGGLRIYSDSTFSRLGDAVGLTARFATGTALTVKSDFMSVGPWKGMRRCILNAMGKITAYEGDDAYETEKADTTKSCGTSFKPTFKKISTGTEGSLTYIDIEVSSTWWSDMDPYYLFQRSDDTIRSEIVISAFQTGRNSGDSVVSFRPDKAPVVNTSSVGFDALYQAMASGTYWRGYHHGANELLFELAWIEAGGLDVQTLIGKGVCATPYSSSTNYTVTTATTSGNTVIVGTNSSTAAFAVGMLVQCGTSYANQTVFANRHITAIDIGTTETTITVDGDAFTTAVGDYLVAWGQDSTMDEYDAMGLDSGYYLRFGSQDRSHVWLYGICDPWANDFKFMRGLMRKYFEWYLIRQPDDCISATDPTSISSAEDMGLNFNISDGYIKTAGVWKGKNASIMYPTGVGASSTTYYAAYLYGLASTYTGVRVFIFGGNFNNGGNCGWYWNGNYTPSNTNINISDREIFVALVSDAHWPWRKPKFAQAKTDW